MTDESRPVSEILSVVVKHDRIAEFDQWMKKVEAALAAQKGFLGREVIRPANELAPEYFILLRFETLADLDAWKNSTVLVELREEIRELIVNVHVGEQQYGTELLFSRPVSNVYYPKPPFWKQVVIGVLVVYPIVLASGAILNPLISGLPRSLGMFFSICLVSPIMITVMPKVSMFFRSWLYLKT